MPKHDEFKSDTDWVLSHFDNFIIKILVHSYNESDYNKEVNKLAEKIRELFGVCYKEGYADGSKEGADVND